MRRFSIILPVALCFVLSACAATSWSKPGTTQAEYNKDSYECERDMRQSGGYGTGLAGALNAQGFEDRCMIARGYTKVAASSAAAPTSGTYYTPTPVCDSNKTTCALQPIK
jgi:hypothetical protein